MRRLLRVLDARHRLALRVGPCIVWAAAPLVFVARALRLLDARDLFGALGLGLVTAGVAQIYVPAAYIVPGVAFLGLAVWRVR